MSIFAFDWRSRFFTDMPFKQNHKGHYGGGFKPKIFAHQQTIFFLLFLQNKKTNYFWGVFGYYPLNEIFLAKNPALSVFYP